MVLKKLLTLLVLWALSFITPGCARPHSNLTLSTYEPVRSGVVTYLGGKIYGKISREKAIEQAAEFCEGKGFRITAEGNHSTIETAGFVGRRVLVPINTRRTWIDIHFRCGAANT